MSYLPFGFAGAQENYADCRETYPADRTHGVLTPSDPCWTLLVAKRRAEGRDPLGRDLWGPAGAPLVKRSDTAADVRAEELGEEREQDAISYREYLKRVREQAGLPATETVGLTAEEQARAILALQEPEGMSTEAKVALGLGAIGLLVVGVLVGRR